MITPYNRNCKIDTGAYRALVEWYLAHRVGGLYANCLSSEMFELDEAERLLLVREAVKTANGRVPVAATGNLGESLEQHLDFCHKVADSGAEVVMLVVPHFLNNEAELERYYLTLAEKVPARLGLYECPVPRSYHLGVRLVRRLAQSGRFFAYKETSGDLPKVLKLLEVLRGTPLCLLQANTPYLLEATRAGAPGTMSIASAWLPDLVSAVIELAQGADSHADKLHNALCAMELAQRAVHPRGTKFWLARRGVPIRSWRARAQPDLTNEDLQALDRAAAHWFLADGELEILSSPGIH